MDLADDDKDRAALVDALRQLSAQGEASGAAVEGNFDADEIARRGHQRPIAAQHDD